MVMNPRSYVLNSMGTGKTKACIWAFDYLRSIGRAQRMLVVCPLSTMDFTWARRYSRRSRCRGSKYYPGCASAG